MYMYVHVLFLSQPPVYNHVNVDVFSHVFIHVSTESHVGWGLHSWDSHHGRITALGLYNPECVCLSMRIIFMYVDAIHPT